MRSIENYPSLSPPDLCTVVATFQFVRVEDPYPEAKGSNKMLLPGAIKIHTAEDQREEVEAILGKDNYIDNHGLDCVFFLQLPNL